MLKGVNKQIIEVTDTGNNYISKAILFVNPDKAGYDRDFLIYQAKKYMEQSDPKPKRPSRRSRLLFALLEISAGAAAGIAMACLFIR